MIVKLGKADSFTTFNDIISVRENLLATVNKEGHKKDSHAYTIKSFGV